MTPLDIDLPLSVTPGMVSPTRLLLESKLAGALDDDAVFRATMTAHELLENAAKYTSDGRARIRVEVTGPGADGVAQLRITLTNNTTREHIDQLRASTLEMRGAADPMGHYFALMRRNARVGTISRLGLARVRAEGEMEIAVAIDGDTVTIVASTVVGVR